MNRILVDLDSGTVINGPVILCDVLTEEHLEDVLNSDDEARFTALSNEIARFSSNG